MANEGLEQKVEGFWTQKFEEFDKMELSAIRTHMLDKFHYLKDNMATPDIWLNHPTEVPKEVYDAIDDLLYVRMYLNQNPKKLEELYSVITGKEVKDIEDKNDDYIRFAYQLLVNATIMPPGEKIKLDGQFIWDTCVKDKIMYGIYNLEKGPTNNYWTEITSQAEKHRQRVSLDAIK